MGPSTTLINLLELPAVQVAPKLLGWRLTNHTPAGPVGGIIVETEAYMGLDDPASHARKGPTPRSAIMFGPPGIAYIYFVYGMHYCINVVTGPAGHASAVLIRALEPTIGLEQMRLNRSCSNDTELTNGPGKLVQALGIGSGLNGHNLTQPPLTLAPGDPGSEVVATSRIIRQANDWPWRFSIKGNSYVSRPIPS